MLGNWIFQAQPKRFQIDKFLEKRPTSTSWLASQHASRIAIGDRVFLWRSIGGGLREESGIFAEARVTAPATLLRSSPDEQEFWIDNSDRDALAQRVRIKFNRIGDKTNLLRRRLLEDDPILDDLSIFDKPIGTNYPISTEQADRIAILWHNGSVKWDDDALVGALWLAALRRIHPLQTERSPLDEFSVRSGRSTADVRSRVETFARMNPCNTGNRQEFGNSLERKIWDRFFDPMRRSLNLKSLNEAYQARWGIGLTPTVTPDGGIEFPPIREAVADETVADFDLLQFDLQELFRKYAGVGTSGGQQGAAENNPRLEGHETRPEAENDKRSRIVIALAKVRAGFRCEVPECPNAPFIGMDNRPYVEVHHIQPLSEGGLDIPNNTAAVCPAHHREAHHGLRATEIKMELHRLRATSAGW